MSRRLNPENFTAEKFRWHQAVTTSPVLGLSAKAVAGLILHDLNASEGGAWRGMESMSELLGVSVRHLRRLIDELQDAKFLIKKVQKGRGKTNRYFATVPTGVVLFPAKSLEDSESASDISPKKRTSVSTYSVKNRTPMSKKSDMDVRQYLDKPIRNSRTPLKPLHKSTPISSRFPNSGIRQQVLNMIGPDRTGSYLDSACWDDLSRTIIVPTSIAQCRLREFIGSYLAKEGIGLVVDSASWAETTA